METVFKNKDHALQVRNRPLTLQLELLSINTDHFNTYLNGMTCSDFYTAHYENSMVRYIKAATVRMFALLLY